MAQAINPTAFRLGKTNDWRSKYFEKKSNEFAIYPFKDLEIRKLIKKYLEKNNLLVHNCKLYYAKGSLHIFVSYYINLKSIFLINNIQDQQIKLFKNYFNYQKLNYNKNLKKNIKITFFLEKLFESLSLFTNNKYNIFLTLNPLNKSSRQTLTKKKIKFIKKHLIRLQKYQSFVSVLYKQNEPFKEGVDLLCSCIVNKKSSHLLAQFIAIQLKKLNKHNAFLNFVKDTLTLFSKLSKNIKGIKIKIKGRLNGARRTKHKTIKIKRNIPILTLDSKINYSESTSFTSNGTFGVKIWIYEKF